MKEEEEEDEEEEDQEVERRTRRVRDGVDLKLKVRAKWSRLVYKKAEG